MMEWLWFILSFIWIVWLYFLFKKRNNTLSKYQPSLQKNDREIGFSLIICVRGLAPHFENYFEKIITQKYSLFELIIVSKDISPQLKNSINSWIEKYSQVRHFEILDDSHPYMDKKQALHLGISKTIYEWIVTIDDDCYPENDAWLSSIHLHLSNLNTDILLGLSPYISQSGWVNQWIRFDAFQVATNYIYQTLAKNPYMGIGRNMTFRKSLWSKEYLEKFKEKGSGDDTTLVQFYKSTKIIDLMVEPLVYSFPNTSFSEWFYQKIRHIQTGNSIDKSQLFQIIQIPFISLLFWLTIWVWLSYFAFHFMIFGCIFVYFFIKMGFDLSLSKQIRYKKLPIFYTVLFDFWYNFLILIMPFLSIFIKKKWK